MSTHVPVSQRIGHVIHWINEPIRPNNLYMYMLHSEGRGGGGTHKNDRDACLTKGCAKPGFLSHLGCSGQDSHIFSCQGTCTVSFRVASGEFKKKQAFCFGGSVLEKKSR